MLRLFALLIALAFPLAVHAAGGGESTNTPDPRLSGGTPRNPDLVIAEKLIKEWKYAEAILHLEKATQADARNADAFNWMGYAHRKLNKLPEARIHYAKALELKPDHRGALEYQGEMFLMLDDLKSAEGNLARLDKLCFFGCSEYADLKKAIVEYKQRKGIAS
ncbi:MAG: tetratricopeptide repeat protein [Alphaproteobacteria bacterium]|nr:tetratricopeptide repeat protein [Alphaproteobacteria bacterium]